MSNEFADLERGPDPAPEIKDFEIVATTAGVRALSHPTRLEMIQLLQRGRATGSMLARTLRTPANRAHYHLQQLLEAGLIQDAGPARANRTEERYYAATARHLVIDPALGGVESRPMTMLRQSIESTFLDWRRAQVLAIDWGVLARQVVCQSLRIGKGDHVAVFFAPMALELAEAIMVEVEAAGGVSHPRPWSRNLVLRTLERLSPEELAGMAFVPEAVDRQLTAAVLLSSNLPQAARPSPDQQRNLPLILESLSRWKQSLRRRSLRYVHVGLPHRGEFAHGYLTPEAGINLFWRCVTADLDQIRARGTRLMRALRDEPDLAIHGANGSELRLTLDPTHATTQDGIISDDDLREGHTTDAVPAGSFIGLPQPGTGDGAFEAAYAFCDGQHIPSVRLVFEAGRIVQVEAPAGAGADVIRHRLAQEVGDPDLIGNVTIGLNPGGRGPSGRPELDSVLAGVVTLHLGNNELWGGSVRSTLNLSFPALEVSLRTRTRSLVRDGRLDRSITTQAAGQEPRRAAPKSPPKGRHS